LNTQGKEFVMKLAHAIFIGTTLASSPAFAAVAAANAAPTLPTEMVQGQVRYVSGGIGQGEARAFRQAERHFPLALEFANAAKPRNEFAADVRVVIRDAKGDIVLDTVSGGPFLLAKLPAGRYEIEATQAGRVLERHATIVEGKPMHVGFLWSIKSTG
jgi:hypothetical protein